MKYIILMVLISNSIWSQNVDQHQWKERVIIINSDGENREYTEQQLQLFTNEKENLIDRKIVLYACVDQKCMFYNWKNTPLMVTKNKMIDGFEIRLIGLDGGVKYTSNKVQKPDVIFKLIDSMPMRREELKVSKKND